MGACVSTDEKKRSQEIDKIIYGDRKRLREEVKLLLLGPGESGKSTVFKQMKIIQDNGGFTTEELQSYKYIVYGNCVTQMKLIVNAALKLNIELESDENRRRAERLTKVPSGGDAWSTELGDDIKHLWADIGIQKAYAMRDRHYQLNDSASYFFENIDQVTAVIFCVALSEYDQTLREDDTQNRMKESLLLFDEICNSHWFRNTTFILFLNKTDLFKEKIQRVDLKVCFPNYIGGLNFEAASAFIKARFLEQNQSPHVIYTHFTCAISTENIEFVFKCVRETVLKKILNEVILY